MSRLYKDIRNRKHLEMGKIIYGPVSSRRFGASLGINPLPVGKKNCSFNCVYCQLGQTDSPTSDPSCLKDYPSSEDIIDAFERKLDSLNPPKIDAITFSGNGEPTLHPELKKVVSQMKEKMDERGVNIPISILTNSSLLHLSSVLKSLKLFDNVIAKLDTVDQDCFLAMNRPVKEMKINKIVDGLKRLRKEIGDKLILQMMVIDSKMDRRVANYGEDKIEKLADAISEINPAYVQIYTVERAPSEEHVVHVDRDKLDWIANVIKEKLGKDCVRVYVRD